MTEQVLKSTGGGQASFGAPPVYQQVRRTLTSAELLDLSTTPIALVAGVVGKVLIPIDATFVYHYGTAAYAGPAVKFIVGSANAGAWPLEMEFSSWFTGSTPDLDYFAAAPMLGPGMTAFSAELLTVIGDALSIAADDNPTLGDGTVDVEVTYRVVDAAP